VLFEIEDVAVVDIAMQDRLAARFGEQGGGDVAAIDEHAAVFGGSRSKIAEPSGKGNERRLRCAARRMQFGDGVAEDAACLVILAFSGHGEQRAAALGSFEHNGIGVVAIDLCRTVTIPPVHHGGARSLGFVGAQLQHGRLVAPQYGQEVAGVGYDRLAVRGEVPAVEIGLEHGWDASRSRPEREIQLPRKRNPAGWRDFRSAG
jgi:hypothetical protein